MTRTRALMAAALIYATVPVACQEPLKSPEQQLAEHVFGSDSVVTVQVLLVLVQGNNQTGVVNGVLADTLIARSMTYSGHPIPGLLVEWHALNGGASLSPPTAYTDENGYTRAVWQLGDAPGRQQAWVVNKFANATFYLATATDSVKRGAGR